MTALSEDEILTTVRIGAAEPGSGAVFEEVARRQGDFAMVGVAASVRLDGDTVTEARIAVSGVAGQPVRAAEAQTLLVAWVPVRRALQLGTCRSSRAS
jgi:aerobic carbon-monoxide dehydrogenase medium subunit